MITVTDLTKSFGRFRALDQVSLNVQKGNVYGLVGPNGAGKSTLIRHLTGVYRPDSGSVTIDGVPVWDNPAVKSKILCIYDDIYYYMHATTRDLMQLYRGLYPNFDLERYNKLREVFPEVKETAPLRSLSKGMLKQSAFWLSMSCRPEILLLDEPVDGLDPVMRRQVMSILMSDVAEYGTTVLLSSHQPPGAGGRVRPRGHSPSRKGSAGTEPVGASGQHLQNPDSLWRHPARGAARAEDSP